MLYDSDDAEYARQQASLLQELIEFEEQRGSINMNNMIKYTIKFG